MKLTFCEFSDDPSALGQDWKAMAPYVYSERSDLVLMPEMPASLWFAGDAHFDAKFWQFALDDHDQLVRELTSLAPATVLSTRPVEKNQKRLNEAFVWNEKLGYQAVHHKTYNPDEPGFFEAKWFHPTPRDFTPYVLGNIKIGFLIYTELMFNEWARYYGRQGCHLIAVPRATERATVERWLLALRMAAIVSEAFVISSNRVGLGPSGVHFGGAGAMISPEGDVLGVTSFDDPIITLEVNLQEAEAAKKKYPRYVAE